MGTGFNRFQHKIRDKVPGVSWGSLSGFVSSPRAGYCFSGFPYIVHFYGRGVTGPCWVLHPIPAVPSLILPPLNFIRRRSYGVEFVGMFFAISRCFLLPPIFLLIRHVPPLAQCHGRYVPPPPCSDSLHWSFTLHHDPSSLSSSPLPSSYRKTRFAFRPLCSTWFYGTSISLACCLPQVDPTGDDQMCACAEYGKISTSVVEITRPPPFLLLLSHLSTPLRHPPLRPHRRDSRRSKSVRWSNDVALRHPHPPTCARPSKAPRKLQLPQREKIEHRVTVFTSFVQPFPPPQRRLPTRGIPRLGPFNILVINKPVPVSLSTSWAYHSPYSLAGKFEGLRWLRRLSSQHRESPVQALFGSPPL